MILNEDEIIDYLNLPSIPKKKWDGFKSFKNAVAVTKLLSGGKSFAVATFDAQRDAKPRVIKVFTIEPYESFEIVGIVPDYMDVQGVGDWDVPEDSKRAAERLISEAKELEEDGVKDLELPKNEYLYDHVHNDEEAKAFILSWNRQRGLKRAKAPKSHDDIITKLTAMWMSDRNKSKK